MDADLKYITFTYGSQTFPVVFPPILIHRDVGRFLTEAFNRAGLDGAKPTSAGFVKISEAKTFGESESLQLNSSPHDAKDLMEKKVKGRYKKMTTQSASSSDATEVKLEDFTVARMQGKYYRFPDKESVPEVATDKLTLEDLQSMNKTQIGELYGTLAGTNPKNFKTLPMATESLVYQINKLSVFDPTATRPAPTKVTTPTVLTGGSGAAPKPAVAPKAPTTIELILPESSKDVIAKLAPQARELILIMADIAEETGSTKFSEKELQDRLDIPEVAARLRTRQPPTRILQYYKGKLVSSGLIKTS